MIGTATISGNLNDSAARIVAASCHNLGETASNCVDALVALCEIC